MPVKLTQKYVDGLRYAGKVETHRDTEAKGLMVVVREHSAVYIHKRDLWVDRKVKTVNATLGRTDEHRLDEARTWARQRQNLMAKGVNPNQVGAPSAPQGEGPSAWSVSTLWQKTEADMVARGLAPRTVEDFVYMRDKYLRPVLGMVLPDLKKSTCRELHERISAAHGKYPANHVLRALRQAWNYAASQDDSNAISRANNPVEGVRFHKERRREAVLLPDDLPRWWATCARLPNPLRRRMHAIQLFSGLRSGTLVGLRREWVDLPNARVTVPRSSMKVRKGEDFILPLSGFLLEMMREALDLGAMLHGQTPWLFPTRLRDGTVQATTTWKEAMLPSETGHILRHTYRSQAELILPDNLSAALLDHRKPGTSGFYVHRAAMFDALREAQERMSSHLKKCVGLAEEDLRPFP